MSFATSPTPETNRIERLLAALEGVISARAIADGSGRVVEIHILSSHELHAKQIVRNVESALSAGLGMLVDRRVISVAQLRPDAVQITAGPLAVPEGGIRSRFGKRQVFVGFDSRCSALDARCIVTLQSDQQNVVGTGTGPNTSQGRAEAAVRALFDALTLPDDPSRLVLEGVTLITSNDKTLVLVAAHALKGRNTRMLTGAAIVNRSPEEAAILASLQATNRITALP